MFVKRSCFLPSLFCATVLICLFACVLGCANAPVTASSKGKSGGKGSRGQGMGQQAMPVAVAKVETRDLPVYLSGLGSVQAFYTVLVKTRVDGQLVQVNFREGQEVKKGDLLIVVDPRPFEVAVAQAEANLAKDQASLKDAQVNLERFKALYQNGGVISKQQLDTQDSLVGQLQGAIASDQAAIANAKLNLTYTHITAPINGRVGLRLVDPGNIVHAADTTGLLLLTQMHPIAVIFTLPEDQLATVAQHMRGGALQVDAYSRDDQTKLASGKLLTIDNQIDVTTGTAKLKAVFDNQEQALWPNQFVNCRLLLEVRKNSTVVPAAAIQRGPQGTYVFTVKPDKTAEMRPVTVALTEGSFADISSGLTPGETVVTDGQDKLLPGSHVEPRTGATPANTAGQNQPEAMQ
jgi:multidrug efflux system membrane fusion protein